MRHHTFTVHDLLHLPGRASSVTAMPAAKYRIYPEPGRLTADSWFSVQSDSLRHDLDVKVRISRRGTPFVSALRIDGGTEVTGRHLRDLRLPEIADEVVRWVRENRDELTAWSSEALARVSDADQDRLDRLPATQLETMALEGWDPKAEALWEAYEQGAAAHALDEHLQAVADAEGEDELRTRSRGARTPTDADYRAFARAWLECATESDYRVMPRVARRLGMSRPTAYRWAAECRQRGLLPAHEGDRS